MFHLLFNRGKASLVGITSLMFAFILLSACQPAPSPAPRPPASATPLPSSPVAALSPSATARPTLQPAASPLPSPTALPAITSPAASPIPTDPATQAASPEPSTAAPTSIPSEPASTPVAAAPTTAACTDKAAFYGDVTIPDDTGFEQAASFTKTWRFRNEGDCTWDSNYALIFAGGEILNAPLVSPLSASIAPGQIANLSLEMRTPDRGGTFRGYWEFQNAQGVRFGTGAGGHDQFWVQVVVSWMPPGGGASGGGSNSGGQTGSNSGASGGASTTPPPASGSGNPGQGNPGAQPTSPASGSPPPAPTETPPAGNPGQGQSSLPGVPAGCDARSNNGYLQSILNLVNRLRRDNGLDELAPSAPLYAAAAVHSADMACRNFVDHIGSDGSSWYTRIAAQGYSYSTALENIMVANPDFGGDAQYAFNWWLNSQVHHDNMLNPKVTEVGIGYVYNPASEYGGYFTLVLARP